MRGPVLPHQHGTRTGYTKGCNCEPCREANRIYQAAYKRRRAATAPPPPKPAVRPMQIINLFGTRPVIAESTPAPGAWVARAACATHDHDLWFPTPKNTGRRGGPDPEYRRTVAAAKRVCRTCPVLADCAAYITAWPQPGIWAGLTENERRQQRRTA